MTKIGQGLTGAKMVRMRTQNMLRSGRPGAFGPIRLIIVHHTAMAHPADAQLKVLTRGRPDLPGPLCQDSIGVDGTLYRITEGRANHAGRGSALTLARAMTGAYRGELRPGRDNIDGNAISWGIEVQYRGDRPMAPDQYASLVARLADLCRQHGLKAHRVIGHREWTRRKVDPGACDMAKLRGDVALALNPLNDAQNGTVGASKAATDPGTWVTLRRGDRGDSVRVAQQRLKARWGSKIVVDGVFGPQMESVVKNFQRVVGLAADGVIGPETWRALYK